MIELAFEIFINLIETFIMTDFVTRYLETKYTDNKKILGFALCWITAFTQMCVMNKITELETIGAFIPIFIYFTYALIFLKGSIGLKLWIAFFTELIAYVIALITNLIICYIIGYNPSDMISVFNNTRIIGVIITKMMLFYTTRIILKNKYKYSLNKYKWLMLICMPVISLISLGALMKVTLYNSGIKLYILIGMSCIVVADIVTYLFFVVMNKEYENTINTRLLEQQNETLKKSMIDKDAFVREMKTVRHDIKNQLLTILQYADEGRCEDIKDYVNVLTNNHLPNILNYINTNNTAFDAAINSKIALCNQKNIFMEVIIKQDTEINIPPTEIAVLFGNLLDNAIEAAKDTVEKRITLEIQRNESYLVILVSNSIKSSVLKENKTLETSKADKELHGIGIKSIKNIVDKHNGMIQFFEEENEFYCHIMIDITE